MEPIPSYVIFFPSFFSFHFSFHFSFVRGGKGDGGGGGGVRRMEMGHSKFKELFLV